MSTNLATVLVGLGYDLSALEKGTPEAFRLINQQTLGMSAEMKRTSREGAESFRLIDEALGIHLSRPLTRILTQEFPAFASGLQSLLGAGVVGALGVAGVELFDKVAKKIEEARAAQEHFAETSRTADETIADVLGGISKRIAEVTDSDHVLRFKLAGAAEAKQGVDQIAKAIDAAQAAGEKANSFWTKAEAAAGDFFSHVAEGWTHIADAFGGDQIAEAFGTKNLHDTLFDTQAFNGMKVALTDMRDSFEDALSSDKTKGTQKALEMAKNYAEAAKAYLDDMRKAGDAAGQSLAANAQKFYDNAVQVETARGKLTGLQVFAEQQAAAAKITETVLGFFREISAEQAKLSAQPSPLIKLEGELDAARTKAIADFDAMRKAGASALDLDHALAALTKLEHGLDAARAAAIASAAVTTAEAGLPTKIAPTGSAPVFAPPNVTPTLGAGGSAGAAIGVFSGDQAAQLKAAAAAYQDLLTPAHRFKIAQGELNILLEKGLIDQGAYTAALQKAAEAESTATDRLEKLLTKTGDAGAGFQAFFLKLEVDGGRMGTFTFDMLNKGLQGFEDETVKLITTGKANWHGYFESLTQEALKFMLNKEIGSFFQKLSDTSIGKALNIPSLAQAGGQQTAAATQLSAGTIMQTAATVQLQAATLMASGGAGSGGGILTGDFAGSFASGTDYAPGGLSWLAEQGPELVNLPSGSSVTPFSGRGSGDMKVFIDAKGAEIGVEEKIARALQTAGPHIVMQAVANVNEIQRRTPH